MPLPDLGILREFAECIYANATEIGISCRMTATELPARLVVLGSNRAMVLGSNRAITVLGLARGDGLYAKLLQQLACAKLLILDDWPPSSSAPSRRATCPTS